jgi:hypothetical protein
LISATAGRNFHVQIEKETLRLWLRFKCLAPVRGGGLNTNLIHGSLTGSQSNQLLAADQPLRHVVSETARIDEIVFGSAMLKTVPSKVTTVLISESMVGAHGDSNSSEGQVDD